MAKFVAVFCVLLLAYGAQCSVLSNVASEIESVISNAKESAASFVNSVNDGITSLKNEAKETVEDISSSIKDVTEKYQKAVASVVSSTTKNIDQCTETAKTKLAAVAENARSDAKDCVTDVTDQMASHVADFKSQYAAIAEYLETVQANATACREIYDSNQNLPNFASTMGCITHLSVDVSSKIPKVLGELKHTVSSTLSSIEHLGTQFEVCASVTAATTAKDTAKAAWKSFEECVTLISS